VLFGYAASFCRCSAVVAFFRAFNRLLSRINQDNFDQSVTRLQRFSTRQTKFTRFHQHIIAKLGTIGWLGLVRQGLSPCKKRQALLGAPTAGVTGKGGNWREKPPDAESAVWG